MFLLLLKLICNFRTGEMDLDEFGPSGFGECPGEQVVFFDSEAYSCFSWERRWS